LTDFVYCPKEPKMIQKSFLFREARDRDTKSATPTSAALSFYVSEMITLPLDLGEYRFGRFDG